MKNFKFLIVLPYYNRPEMFRNGLKSLLESTYDNWHLAVIDDGSDEGKKAQPILEELLGEDMPHKYILEDTRDTIEMKLCAKVMLIMLLLLGMMMEYITSTLKG